MNIRWSLEARDDVDRLVEFVSVHDPSLANDIERELSQAPRRLLHFPRRGPRLSMFDLREVREYRVRNYLIRYEVSSADIVVLRVFHAREDRF